MANWPHKGIYERRSPSGARKRTWQCTCRACNNNPKARQKVYIQEENEKNSCSKIHHSIIYKTKSAKFSQTSLLSPTKMQIPNC